MWGEKASFFLIFLCVVLAGWGGGGVLKLTTSAVEEGFDSWLAECGLGADQTVEIEVEYGSRAKGDCFYAASALPLILTPSVPSQLVLDSHLDGLYSRDEIFPSEPIENPSAVFPQYRFRTMRMPVQLNENISDATANFSIDFRTHQCRNMVSLYVLQVVSHFDVITENALNPHFRLIEWSL